jgi:hypothetical protein
MKKLFVASVLALAVIMASQTTASAWSEFKFSAGINFGWVGGGNRILWGAYHSAPFPCQPDVPPLLPFQVAYYGGSYNVAGGSPIGGYGMSVAGGSPYGAPVVPAVPAAPVPHAQAAPPADAGAAQYQSYNPYYNAGYQPVGYSYPGYSQAPGYWYGR